jgi:hypothetical protein
MEKSVTRYDTYSTRTMWHPLRVLILCAALAVAAMLIKRAGSGARIGITSSVRCADARGRRCPCIHPSADCLPGDSLTAGYGLDVEQSVPSLVQKHLDAEGYKYEVVNAGCFGRHVGGRPAPARVVAGW